jgi:hypothetical protein
MTERNEIKFQPEEPVKVVLKYDHPTDPVGKYKTQYWGCEDGRSIKLTPKLLEKIEFLNGKAGDEITITKKQGDGYTFFDVVKDGINADGEPPSAQSKEKPAQPKGKEGLIDIIREYYELQKKLADHVLEKLKDLELPF